MPKPVSLDGALWMSSVVVVVVIAAARMAIAAARMAEGMRHAKSTRNLPDPHSVIHKIWERFEKI